jgi:hypothetical protein
VERLARIVSATLSKRPFCTIYDRELTRVWGANDESRKNAVMRFAEEHGWALVEYVDDFCAIFTKALPKNDCRSTRTVSHEREPRA